MSRRVRFSDVSLPVVLAVVVAALAVQRWVVAATVLAAVGVLGVVGRLTRRVGRATAALLDAPPGELVLVYLYSPL